MCFRCQATRRIDEALTGPNGTVPAALQPVCDAIVAADNPRSILNNFTRNKSLALLSSTARGAHQLSHDGLDQHAASWSTEHLRALLVAAGALPERDENVARLHRFVADLADPARNPCDRRLLSAFARWDVLPRLRRRYPDRPVPINAAYRCREQLATALRLLDFLHERSRDLEDCRQADIDAWFATQPPRVGSSSKVFLGWARRHGKMSSSLTVPVSHGSQPKHFSIAADRWARAHSLLLE
jgi:hypothetical protein